MNYCCKLLFVKEMLIESKKENESNKIVKHIMEWGDPKKRAKLDLCSFIII